jgi:hypothetical protein
VNADNIAAALGGAVRSGNWWRAVCPVHGSRTGTSPTLALRDGERGIIVHCHAGCDARDVLAALRARGLLHGHTGFYGAEAATSHADDAARRIVFARRIWEAATDPSGSPVVRYLYGRGITIPVPRSLRWAPALKRPDGGSGPAMVARIDNVDGELIGVHRTWLHRDAVGIWRREDRAMLGRAAGGAVRLAPAADTLLVAEGIETALAGLTAAALPAWAALSTGGLVALELPAIVRHIIILADNDRSGAGERAARTAARRWVAEGRDVRLAIPPLPGTDMADVLAGGPYAPLVEAHDVAG